MEPKPAEPVKDAVLLWSVGLRLRWWMGMGLGTRLGMRVGV